MGVGRGSADPFFFRFHFIVVRCIFDREGEELEKCVELRPGSGKSFIAPE